MSPRPRKDTRLIIGGSPRADLLPPEITIGKRLRSQRRGLLAVLVIVIVIVVGGYAGASFLAQSRSDAFAAANAKTASLLAEQARYAEVNRANSGIATATRARATAMSTEIDWRSEIVAVVGTLPSGSNLTALSVTSATPIAPVADPSSPLEGSRVAELKLTLSTKDIPDTAKWIRDLSALAGFVDATPSTIVADTGTVTTSLILHLNDAVYWNRFASEASK